MFLLHERQTFNWKLLTVYKYIFKNSSLWLHIKFLYKIEHEINETSNVGQFMGMSFPWFVDHHLRSLSESICPIVLCRLVYTCENLKCNYCLRIDLYYTKYTHQRTVTTLSILSTPWRIENCGKGASEFVFKLFSVISCLKQEAYMGHIRK